MQMFLRNVIEGEPIPPQIADLHIETERPTRRVDVHRVVRTELDPIDQRRQVEGAHQIHQGKAETEFLDAVEISQRRNVQINASQMFVAKVFGGERLTHFPKLK